jgi:predicted transcriptional regulator of viral defense system
MIYPELLKIEKPFFSLEDVAYVLGIQLASAAVVCSRYVKKGLLTRLKRGLYTRTEDLAHLGQIDLFRIANFLEVPSYISLMTAISYHGITTQVQRGFLESISIKRTRKFEVGQFAFHYMKVRPKLYRGFEKREEVFIALPEKALLDSFYLASIGRYSLDVSSLDLTSVNEEILADLSLQFPLTTRKYMERYYGGKVKGS